MDAVGRPALDTASTDIVREKTVRKTMTALGVAAVTTLLTVSQASAATQVYEGTGWRLAHALQGSDGIHALDPSGTYTITFASDAARSALSHYYTPLASYLTAQLGVKFVVGATNAPGITACSAVPYHTIIVDWKTKPVGTSGESWTYACYNAGNDTEWGAMIEIDKEYWDHPGWFSGGTKDDLEDYATIWNVTAHELGHAVGLLHPNQLDASGNDIPSACPKDSKGWLPIMCTPTTGQNITNAGINYTSFDLAGMKQLVANFGLPAPSATSGVSRPRAVPAGEE